MRKGRDVQARSLADEINGVCYEIGISKACIEMGMAMAGMGLVDIAVMQCNFERN